MTLAEYIKGLQDFVKENPEAANMTAVYSRDDEGNGYQEVYYTPTLGQFNEDEREFRTKASLEGYEDDEELVNFVNNAVCIN